MLQHILFRRHPHTLLIDYTQQRNMPSHQAQGKTSSLAFQFRLLHFQMAWPLVVSLITHWREYTTYTTSRRHTMSLWIGQGSHIEAVYIVLNLRLINPSCMSYHPLRKPGTCFFPTHIWFCWDLFCPTVLCDFWRNVFNCLLTIGKAPTTDHLLQLFYQGIVKRWLTECICDGQVAASPLISWMTVHEWCIHVNLHMALPTISFLSDSCLLLQSSCRRVLPILELSRLFWTHGVSLVTQVLQVTLSLQKGIFQLGRNSCTINYPFKPRSLTIQRKIFNRKISVLHN